MCPFCWSTVVMVTAGVASTGTLGAVLVRTGLVRAGEAKADMYEPGMTNVSEERSGNDNQRD
jgi:hypothetical protein